MQIEVDILFISQKINSLLNKKSMESQLDMLEMMGDNVRSSLKYCGEEVILYPLCKIINARNLEIDDNSRIMDFAYIDAGTGAKIGKYSFVTWHAVIEGNAKTTIGDRCFVGPGAKLLTSTYQFDGFFTNEKLPEETRQTLYGDIILENDAYVGANSVVMPGVKIGEGAVVGANSLVTSNCKPWGIYFGNPAKRIGWREKPTEERRKIVEAMDWTKHF